ncbi:LmeA family phospholipid-binding protein [Arthrobacter sp. B1805]|uniref:LmeA family phospholipid-binding protein n=1 Tax=Arthrobacter sp. B1805 TaxID=2058892 RepID=UPI000CE2FC03|nr:LmeA family phospholipid-binding protein [Arthrobacter sp. B1805]
MNRTRVKDWVVGATAMILVLVVAVGTLWWLASNPADREKVVTGTPAPGGSGQTRDAELPQNLPNDELWFSDLVLKAGTVMTEGSTLRDVQAAGQGVMTTPDGLNAAWLTVDATVPFDVVAQELGTGTVVRAAEDGQATVIRTVEVLGRELDVVATGTVTVEAGRLVVEPQSIDFGGPELLSGATAAVIRGLVTIEHDIEGLPEGLVLEDVTVHSDGFRATLQGEDISFAR